MRIIHFSTLVFLLILFSCISCSNEKKTEKSDNDQIYVDEDTKDGKSDSDSKLPDKGDEDTELSDESSDSEIVDEDVDVTDDDQLSGLNFEQYKNSYADIFCGHMFSCCPKGFDYLHTDIMYRIESEQDCRESFFNLEDNPRWEWNPEKAAECIAKMREIAKSFTCESSIDFVEAQIHKLFELGAICYETSEGIQDVGQECKMHDECKPELLCNGSACFKPGLESESCEQNTECDFRENLYCFDKSCAKYKNEGETCGDEQCEPTTLYCGSENKCMVKRGIGESCGEHYECIDYFCYEGVCRKDPMNGGNPDPLNEVCIDN